MFDLFFFEIINREKFLSKITLTITLFANVFVYLFFRKKLNSHKTKNSRNMEEIQKKKSGSSIGGLVFVGCMFIGGGIGMYMGKTN
jgi:UDP-N-acetylmuramyl pentapeptide phosphotransferase/UDP-N-acetylglucosamine-1-phosphate transferase